MGFEKNNFRRPPEKPIPARWFAVPRDPDFRSDAAAIQIFHQEPDGPEFQIAAEDSHYLLCLRLIDLEAAINHVVAKWDQTTHPHSLLLGSGDLVPDPFAGHLALELGEGQQDVERQASHRCRRVELLRDSNERDT